jgi:predicted outer membrane repeat protein
MKFHLLLFLIFCTLICLFTASYAARTWYVNVDQTGNTPTIQSAVDSSSPGDLILLGPGRYTWEDQGTGDEFAMVKFVRGVTDIEIRSEAGREATILDAQGQGRVLYLMAYNTITFDGLTITGGEAPLFGDFAGGAIAAHINSSTFKNCTIKSSNAEQGGGAWIGGVSSTRFENCRIFANTATYGAGILLVNSNETLTFVDCIFERNAATLKGGGVFAYNTYNSFENCVFFKNTAVNEGGAFHCEQSHPSTMTNCTLSENSAPLGGGVRVFNSSILGIQNCIIAYSTNGAGISMAASSTLDIGCTNLYGNAGGDAVPPGSDLGGNFSLDPQFCGVLGSHYYYLQSDSPCAIGNPPYGLVCGNIGAFPVNCGSVSTENETWGWIKTIYR